MFKWYTFLLINFFILLDFILIDAILFTYFILKGLFKFVRCVVVQESTVRQMGDFMIFQTRRD